MVFQKIKTAACAAVTLSLSCMAGAARATDINMPEGVTPSSHEIYGLHMMVFWVCVGIAVVVFGAMFIAIFGFRKSAGAKPANFHDSTAIEIAWTIVPVIILVAMAIPAAKVLVRMSDTSDPSMTIKIVGYQWKWEYDYIQDGFSFFSMLAQDSDAASQLHSDVDPASIPNYLREVDHPLVVPAGEKVRLLITSDDVIHSWWLPDFGIKTDAIPGYINVAWFKAEQPGIYRGACAELCGRWHGFMPTVVVVKSLADYQAWVNATKAAHGAYISPYDGKPETVGSPVAFSEGMAPAPAAPAPAATPTAAPAPAKAPAAKKAATPAQASTAASTDMQAALAQGKQVYDRNCSACHMPDGKGNAEIGAKAIAGGSVPNGPLLAHIQLVLHGKGIMRAWGNELSDADLAAVITYERNAFGNHTGDLVRAADVKAAR